MVRNNKYLGDSLQAMLLRRGKNEWDVLLPQLLGAYRETPHTVTEEAANMLMSGRELGLPNQLQHHPPPEESSPQHEFVLEMRERSEQAHEALRQQQLKVRQDDQEEPLLTSFMINKVIRVLKMFTANSVVFMFVI